MATIKDMASGVADKAGTALGKVHDLVKPMKKSEHEIIRPSFAEGNISPKAAIMMMYYLIALDGEVSEDEMKQFDEMGMAIDSMYPHMKQTFISECRKQMDKAIDPEDYYDVIQEGADYALTHIPRSKFSEITPKLLLWNLLVIAQSDHEYAEIERKFLKFTARKLDIDKSVFLEMEQTIQTLQMLDAEMEWLKTTERPYAVIEKMVKELEERQQIIRKSIAALIA